MKARKTQRVQNENEHREDRLYFAWLFFFKFFSVSLGDGCSGNSISDLGADTPI